MSSRFVPLLRTKYTNGAGGTRLRGLRSCRSDFPPQCHSRSFGTQNTAPENPGSLGLSASPHNGSQPAVSTATATIPVAAAAAVVPRPRTLGSRVLMWFGATLVGLLVIDNFLQYQYAKEAQDTVDQLAKEEQEFRHNLLNTWKDQPALFVVKAVIKYKMGGTMGLRGVTEGDLMEVLEQEVGPNNGYYLCRTRDDQGQIASIGWYPISFVEKLEQVDEPPKRAKYLGLF